MKGICNNCVFPLTKEETERTGTCVTDTSLTYAARAGKISCVKDLIAAGADVNATCECHGNCALMVAFMTGHINCKCHGNGPLISAIVVGHTECVKELIAAGANVNIRGKDQTTALMFAVGRGKADLVKMLISAGADVNFKDKYKSTALMVAAGLGNVDFVKMLISAGADVNMGDEQESTALLFAADIRCVQELISTGADVNTQNSDKITPLLIAAKEGNVDCWKFLISAGTDITVTDKLGITALDRAIINKNIDFVRELIAAGSNVTSSLMQSVKVGSFECVEELVKAGADVDVADGDGNTSLMVAAEMGIEAIIQLLLDNGAEVNVENHHSKTALDLAIIHAENYRVAPKAENNYVKTVYLLLQAGAQVKNMPVDIRLTTFNSTPLLKMLLAAGAEFKYELFTSEESLLNLTRKYIRNHLKNVHQKMNLYKTIPQLGLPHQMTSYLLFHTLEKVKSNSKNKKYKFLHKMSQGDMHGLLNLIQAGVDVNTQDQNGMTAVMIAAEKDNVKLIEELSRAGVNVNIQTYVGDTALICTIKKRQHICVQKLLELGAKIDIEDGNGLTALMHTVETDERYDMLQMLIEAGTDVNIQNNSGKNTLMLAAAGGYIKSLEILLNVGANVNMVEEHGLTALMIAACSGKLDCLRKLITAGAELRTTGVALILAAKFSQVKCVKELIHAGADLNMQGNNGKTALTTAAENGSLECVRTLLKAGAEVNSDFLCDTANAMLLIGMQLYTIQQYETTGLLKLLTGEELEALEAPMDEVHQFLVDKETIVKEFFKAGITPNYTKNYDSESLKGPVLSIVSSQLFEEFFYEDNFNVNFATSVAAAFEYFGWKYPLRLSTLCKQKVNEEMSSVIPLQTGCPMTIMRRGRRYLATVARGEAISLQGDKSDVKLQIDKGCPKRAYLMEVRTDLANCKFIIPEDKFILPDDECFISPIVKVLAPAETNTSSYVLRIPHCLDENDDKTKVKVRMIHENRVPAVPPVEVPKGNVGALFYDINDRFIELHTTHFTTVICTICQNPYHCLNTAANYWFTRFDSHNQEADSFLHDVEIRPYFGGVLHTIVDFRKDVEASVNLSYVTTGNLKISRRPYNPESGLIQLDLQITDKLWQPRLGLKNWNETSRTFAKEVDLLDVINLEYGHKCRSAPVEAAVYSLEATGKELERFRANATAEVTVDVETKDQEKKQQRSSLELPVDFSKEDLAKESNTSTESFKRKGDFSEPVKKNKVPKFSLEEIESKVETAGLDQLPEKIHSRELVPLAQLFSPSTLEMVALEYFRISQAVVSTLKAVHRENIEAFKRGLIRIFIYKGHNRKDLYLVLLKAESGGILEDVDMTKIEKLILDPGRDEIQEKTKSSKLSKEEIDSRVEAAGLDEFSEEIHPRELVPLAQLFSPSTLESVALGYFGILEAAISSMKTSYRENIDALKRDILQTFIYTGHSRKDLYRALLKAESEGILNDVEMEKVEKLILDPERETKTLKSPDCPSSAAEDSD